MKFVLGLLTASILTVSVADDLFATVEPAAEIAGDISIQAVVRRAQMDALLEMPWEAALYAAGTNLVQGGEAITVDGTTVRWSHGEYCRQATVADQWTPIVTGPCGAE